MPDDERVIRYATGEEARVGDRVDQDVWPHAVVVEVIASADDVARWGVGEPGLMINSAEGGWVFEPRSSIVWDTLVLKSRSK